MRGKSISSVEMSQNVYRSMLCIPKFAKNVIALGRDGSLKGLLPNLTLLLLTAQE